MYKIYQVEYGDTLDLIAQKTNTTVDNIKKLNGFTNNEDISVGSLIIVPKVQDDIFMNYKVKKGDNIYSIARAYNVNPEMLLMINGLDRDDYIYPDMMLLIPKSSVNLYITKDGDTYNDVAMMLGMSAGDLNDENKRIYVLKDQLVIGKKDTKN